MADSLSADGEGKTWSMKIRETENKACYLVTPTKRVAELESNRGFPGVEHRSRILAITSQHYCLRGGYLFVFKNCVTGSWFILFPLSLSGCLGIWVNPDDSDQVWKVGGACGQLLLSMWPRHDRLGTKYRDHVHLLLSSGLHPRICAQHHCPLGPLQTHQVQPVTSEPVFKSPVSMAHTAASLSPVRTAKRWSSWSTWRWRIWPTSSLCPSGFIITSHTFGRLDVVYACSASISSTSTCMLLLLSW